MMGFTDLGPAADRMADLVRGVPDDLLDAPTPCAGYTVRALLDHVDGLALGLAAAAAKATGPADTEGTVGRADHLAPGWRTRIPERVAALAEAWRDPDARAGMTWAGGIELPAGVAAVVALEELVIHGWDLARATGREIEVEAPALEAVQGFLSAFGDDPEARGGGYAAPVPVADHAPLLDRVVALSGRDPSWPDA
ncbi:MAG TPA: TIGR03086 family metal-binding protein [Acidimicrobiales bacterium]